MIGEESYLKHSVTFPEAESERLLLKGFREPVTAYRLHGKGNGHPPDDVIAPPLRERTSLGAIVFGILGAPCAISTLIGPLAVALGASGLFGLTAALVFLDQSIIRIPILVLTALAASANLYTLWHARKLRIEAGVAPHLLMMTALEKHRTLFVLVASLAALGIVAFEIVAHVMLH